jgi:hypothetical protein
MQRGHKTTELAQNERLAVERLLGRELRNDECVEIIAHRTARLPVTQDAECRKAVSRIRELAKGKSLGGATVRDLIDEGRRF